MNKSLSFIQSIPSLFIVCSRSGQYLDYMGGADVEQYTNLSVLENNGLQDFFTLGLVSSFLKNIELSLEYQTITEISYSIDHKDDKLKVQYYRARISPFINARDIYKEEAVLLSIQNETEVKMILEKVFESIDYDPQIERHIYNARALRDYIQEACLNNPSMNVITVSLAQLVQILPMVPLSKLKNVEEMAAKFLSEVAEAGGGIAGRLSAGVYQVVAEMPHADLIKSCGYINTQFQGKYFKSRNNTYKIPISFELIAN